MVQYIIAGIALVLMCVMPIIVGYLACAGKRRRAERELEIAEEQLELARQHIKIVLNEKYGKVNNDNR